MINRPTLWLVAEEFENILNESSIWLRETLEESAAGAKNVGALKPFNRLIPWEYFSRKELS